MTKASTGKNRLKLVTVKVTTCRQNSSFHNSDTDNSYFVENLILQSFNFTHTMSHYCYVQIYLVMLNQRCHTNSWFSPTKTNGTHMNFNLSSKNSGLVEKSPTGNATSELYEYYEYYVDADQLDEQVSGKADKVVNLSQTLGKDTEQEDDIIPAESQQKLPRDPEV